MLAVRTRLGLFTLPKRAAAPETLHPKTCALRGLWRRQLHPHHQLDDREGAVLSEEGNSYAYHNRRPGDCTSTLIEPCLAVPSPEHWNKIECGSTLPLTTHCIRVWPLLHDTVLSLDQPLYSRSLITVGFAYSIFVSGYSTGLQSLPYSSPLASIKPKIGG